MKTPARVLGLVVATVVMFAAGTGAALADAPTGAAWPEGELHEFARLLEKLNSSGGELPAGA